MIQDTPSSASVRKFYDFFGKRYDLFSFYEARAKARALSLLDLAPGQKFLNVGVGTGLEHLTIMTQLGHDGTAYGVDISRKMLTMTHQRTGSPLCEADGRLLPFSSALLRPPALCLYAGPDPSRASAGYVNGIQTRAQFRREDGPAFAD